MIATGLTIQNRATGNIREVAVSKDGSLVLVAPFKAVLHQWNPKHWRHYERLALDDEDEPTGPLSAPAGAGGLR